MVRIALVKPPDRPKPGGLVIGPQSHGAIGAAREFDEVVLEIAIAAQHRARRTGAVELVPHIAARKAHGQTAVANEPVAKHEIEIAANIVRHGLLPMAGET
ncbi:hypothetical protein OEG86_21180 [Hoeflea alexandrii]|uniref:hypothetical protein n=1 Tax=Hoeflea alexandrii TaxID=288436 RepID=UPI00226EF002|nr:hypothetical protein [Hoeflea alexandrii]MCY0154327.1 hypothetical protein [Hoeflea alexandrii]